MITAVAIITIWYLLICLFIPYISYIFYYIWKIFGFFMFPINFIDTNIISLPDYLFVFVALIPFFVIWYIIYKFASQVMSHSN